MNKKFVKKIFLTTLITSFLTSSFPSFSEKTDDSNIVNLLKSEITEENSFIKNETLQENVYVLGPGDIVSLISLSLESLNGQYEIFNDGSISIPILGNINIEGMSIKQANKYIEDKLGKELLDPTVILNLIFSRPINVSIIGQIQSPGVYSLSSKLNQSSNIEGANQKQIGYPKLINAIQLAGGITQKANLKKVTLKRKLPGKENGHKIANIDLFELIINGDQKQNPYLFDGDVITLNSVKNDLKDLNSSSYFNVSPQKINVNIMGEVNNPGKYQLQSNLPLSQAIVYAGGPKNWRANTGNVSLVRINRDGSVTLKKYRINLNQGVSDNKNPPLRNNDSILVKRTNFAKTTDAIKSVSDPVSGVVTIWSLFKLIGG